MLYIHIPFCDSKCNYCAFNSYTNINHLKKEYFDALKRQFLSFPPQEFYTVFIGGGTPSTMPVEFYEQLFKMLESSMKDTKEITIEANPTVSAAWLKEIRNFGVNRISLGIQSFNDEKLKFLNRNHTSKRALRAVEEAKKAGFDNINIDLIYATAVDNKELLKRDLDIAFSLPISHISAYSLTIEENSKFAGDYSKRKEDEELEIFFINSIKGRFFQYEISNFGKPCLHNLGYWEGRDYMGLGAGAVGFEKNYRYYSLTNVSEYIATPTKYEYEYLSNKELKYEKIFLGLRSVVGVEKSILTLAEYQKVKELVKENKLYEKSGKIYSRDFLLADAISAYLMED